MSSETGGARYLSTAEAAALLGIRPSTLYSYVSRGRIRSEADPEDGRASRFLASEVERLVERRRARHEPELLARKALDWGEPVLESGLTLIRDGRLHYRGRDALELARRARFEDVVRLLWGWEAGRPAPTRPFPRGCREALDRLETLPPVERMQALLPLAGAEDPAGFDLRPESVMETGWAVLDLLAAGVTLRVGGASAPLATRLARGWNVHGPETLRLLDTTLILCADHELNGSAFAVRVVASTGSSPWDAVAAGLAALRGPRHGGHTARVEALLDEAGTPDALHATIAGRLRRGEEIPGFGHPLYPDGDPRAALLFSAVEEGWPESLATGFVRAARRAGPELLGEEASLDFALVLVRRALGLPSGSALVLFAVGRTAGWVAHAMEQYAGGRLLRPRAAYIGPDPEAETG